MTLSLYPYILGYIIHMDIPLILIVLVYILYRPQSTPTPAPALAITFTHADGLLLLRYDVLFLDCPPAFVVIVA